MNLIRSILALAAAALACGDAVAASLSDLPPGLPVVAPLPRPRPPLDGAGRLLPVVPRDPAAEARHEACLLRLTALAEAEPEPPAIGHRGCETSELVRVTAFRLPGGERIAVRNGATVRCSFAEALAYFVREDVIPAVAPLKARLAALVVDSSYECRPRNRIAGAKMSEHGTGNALDVRGIALADGRTVLLADPAADKVFRTRIAEAACRRFDTVLGPGSDGFHEEHVHFDLARHSHGVRVCKWDIRDPTTAARKRPHPAPQPEPETEPEEPVAEEQ